MACLVFLKTKLPETSKIHTLLGTTVSLDINKILYIIYKTGGWKILYIIYKNCQKPFVKNCGKNREFSSSAFAGLIIALTYHAGANLSRLYKIQGGPIR